MDTIPRPIPVTITINLPAKTLNFIRTWATRVRYAEGDGEAIAKHEAIVSEAVIDAIKTEDRFLLEEGDPTPMAEGPEYLIYIFNGLTSKCFPVKVTDKTSNQDLATMIERHEERPCHESFALRDRKGKLIYGEKSSIFAGEARQLVQDGIAEGDLLTLTLSEDVWVHERQHVVRWTWSYWVGLLGHVCSQELLTTSHSP